MKNFQLKNENKMTEKEIEEDFKNLMNDYDEYQRKKAIKAMFHIKNISHEISDDIHWYEVPFYWVKTLICLLFHRISGNYLNDAFAIVYWDQTKSCGENSGYDWKTCLVNKGVLKNWNVAIISDSSY